MKHKFVAALLMLGASTMLHAQGVNPDKGRNNPIITAEDLVACKNELAEFHRREIEYLKNSAKDYCTKGKDTHYDTDTCRNATEWVRESSSTSNLTWFMKGNDHCEGSDYTCFGISIFNEGIGEELVRDLAKHPLPKSVLADNGKPWDYSGFWGYYPVVHGCIARQWLAKLDGKNSPGTGIKKSGKTPAGNSSPTKPAAAEIRPDPPSAPGKLSQQQTTSCSEEIRRTQLESQSWPGDANAVAARLGRFQKDLFEGRCAAHPEAQAYLAGANKMLGHGGNATTSGSGSLPPLASSGSSGGSGTPDPKRSRKVHNPAADAKGCTQLIQGRERGPLSPVQGNLTFVNNCPTAVEFFWCSDNECTRGSGNTWTIRKGGSWPVDGTNVRWGACRGKDSGGFDKGSQGQKYTCPLLKW